MLLLVLIGGAAGAVARWSTDVAVRRRWPTDLPVGTFLVNLAGCLLLGVVLGVAAGPGGDPAHQDRGAWSALLAIGFCGSFTTFSTFAFEIVRLAETGRGRTAALYAAASVALGCGLAALGWLAGQQLA